MTSTLFRWVRVRVATGLLIIPAHYPRHLWQARQVAARPDFPGGAVSAARLEPTGGT